MQKLLAITIWWLSFQSFGINPSKQLHKSANGIEGLTFIGSGGGKQFFTYDKKMSREAGKSFCQKSQMELASVTSDSQVQAIFNSANIHELKGYWTSGIEKVVSANFLWEDTLTSAVDLPFKNIEKQRCLAVGKQDGTTFFYTRPCSYESLRPLCETKTK